MLNDSAKNILPWNGLKKKKKKKKKIIVPSHCTFKRNYRNNIKIVFSYFTHLNLTQNSTLSINNSKFCKKTSFILLT